MEWYDATVRCANDDGTYTLDYADGEVATRAPVEWIRPREEASAQVAKRPAGFNEEKMQYHVVRLEGEELQEGMRAFAEKRAPNFFPDDS